MILIRDGKKGWIALFLKIKILDQPLFQIKLKCLLLVIKIGTLKYFISRFGDKTRIEFSIFAGIATGKFIIATRNFK